MQQRNKSPPKTRTSASLPLTKGKQPNMTSEDKCRQRLLNQLLKAKDNGILDDSMALESHDFEKIEFYGDSILYQRVSKVIMVSRRFMDPHMMTQLRSAIVKNSNLARVFDVLELGNLFEKPVDPSFFTLKNKADVVEAIVGELDEKEQRKLLDEFISYICHVGEKEYTLEVNEQAVSEEIKNMHAANNPEPSLFVPTIGSTKVKHTRPTQPTEGPSALKVAPVVNAVPQTPKLEAAPKPMFFKKPAAVEPVPQVHLLKKPASQPMKMVTGNSTFDPNVSLAKLMAARAIEATLAT